jgi:hypothetical protein
MMIKNHPLRHLFSVSLLLLLLVGACNVKDYDGLEFEEHDAQYAFSLLNTTLEISDLVNNILNDSLSTDTIVINADQTMTLFYSGDVAEKQATDIFQFFETGLVPIADTIFNAPFEAPDSVTVFRIDFNAGQMNLLIRNPLSEPITGTFYILQMTENGVPFSMPFTAPANSVSIPWISPAINMDGKVLTSSNNTLTFRYEAYLPDGTKIVIPEISPGTPGIAMLFQNITFSYMEGYYGYNEYPLTTDTIDIDINQTNLDGDVTITDPKVRITVANSYGFPTRGKVTVLKFVGSDGIVRDLESTVIDTGGIDFNYPSLAAGEVGQFKYTSFDFDRTNSNIDEIFNSQPTQLIYAVNGIANVNRDPNLIGFLTDSSVIRMQVEVELLLEGSLRNFGAEQLLDFDFGEFADSDISDLSEIEFKLVTENKTPIASTLQMRFLDENGAVIDSLFDSAMAPFVINSPAVDANGVAIGVERTETFIPMSIERFDRVRKSKQMYLETSFTTADNGNVPVKILADGTVVIKMGLKIKTKF